MSLILATARIGINRLRTVGVQMSRDVETWEPVATYEVPEADRAFYRITFNQ